VLPRLTSDLPTLLERSIEPGGLSGAELDWSDRWAVTVVLASAGYPASSSRGDVIRGLETLGAASDENGSTAGEVEITHAGTQTRNGEIVTAGGRVLNVTGMGDSPEQARTHAYSAVERISFEGAQYRRDIAARAVERVTAGR
jgi:phosphoribosylamine---glycine ligase